jgi:Contractile injection system tube protein/LysM domain
MALTKAQLYNADTGVMVVECHFNPEEVSISKSNMWEPENSSGTNLPDVHFKGEGARSLSLTLVFDTYELRTDVRSATNKVLGLMEAPEDRTQNNQHARPPHVMFRWGTFETFPAVITQLSQRFSLFLETGVPVRATLNLTLQEVPQQAIRNQTAGQNPTSRAAGARRVRSVQPGDTIDVLAALELGEPTQWRRLAEANNLDDPRRLRAGQTLLIPVDV